MSISPPDRANAGDSIARPIALFKVREYASKDDLKKYQMAESNFALGYFGLGFCNLRMGKSDLAQAAFTRAQQIDPALAQLISDVQQPGGAGGEASAYRHAASFSMRVHRM